jgi:hypothetical protein
VKPYLNLLSPTLSGRSKQGFIAVEHTLSQAASLFLNINDAAKVE